MDKKIIQQKIRQFLNENELGIISTIHADKNAPESAVVGFGNNEELELVFGTSSTTRKYANLQKNPNVAFVIGWSSKTGTLQYEGIARELSGGELTEYVSLLIKKNQNHTQFLHQANQKYFLVKPNWLKFYDNAGSPPDVYELVF